MPRYRIYPPIGLARLGQDEDFFLGPERPEAGAMELLPDGALAPVTRWKDPTRTRLRKQGARFHLFESSDDLTWTPAVLPKGATVTWSVTLVNKKAAVDRGFNPPVAPTRPVIAPGNEAQVISGGTRQVSGPGAVSEPFTGTYSTAGYEVPVPLGRLRTDPQGRLIVLGGDGFSSAPTGTPIGGSYYRNPRWHDDVADGPVQAAITLPGATPVPAEGGAWVVVAPPDYAPGLDCIVTLYDVLRQLGIDQFGLAAPGQPSFDRDIAPLARRVSRLRFVHADATWSDPRLLDPRLRSAAPADQPLRAEVRDLITFVEEIFQGHTMPSGPRFELRAFQRTLLDRWVAGDFDPTPTEWSLTPESLTRAALEAAAGQGFCPGIEAGIIVLDPTLYQKPFDFRIDQAAVQPGDLTALMAQPWQADFLKCNTEWWPTQRPDLAPQPDGTIEDWIRGAAGHRLLVERSPRLGLVAQQRPDELFVEVERDPTL